MVMENLILLSNKDKIRLNEYIPKDSALLKTANYFQNFSDSTCLKIIICLAICDMCVNDLSIILNINQTTISHQLRLLKDQDIVSYRRDGKILVYSLRDKKVNDLMYIAAS